MKRIFLCLFATWTIGAQALPRLELDLRLDPETRHFTAHAILTDEQAISAFRLSPAFEIIELRTEGRPQGIRPSPDRMGWYSVPAGVRRIELRYRAQLPATPVLDHRQALRPLATSAPEGSFLPASSAWYPQVEGFFTYRVSLSLPKGQKGLVPGTLLEERETGQGYRARFDFPWPADGIELMAGPYVIEESWLALEGRKIRLRTYFHAELRDLARAYLDDAARYLERYSREIGPYPFESFSIVSSPTPTGFGMPTLTYLGREVVKLPFIRKSSLRHEVLHNWWGNGVYPDWRQGNWSEGLTTLMADHAFKEEESELAAREMRLGWLRDYAALPAKEEFALKDFTARGHGIASIIGYNKAAMVFLMLRDMIGAEAFQRGIRLFWQRHRFQTASWRDLEAAFSEAAQQDLRSFFAQWVEKAEAPSFSAEAIARDRDYRLWRKLPAEELPPILRETLIAPRVEVVVLDAELEAASQALLPRLLDDQTPQRVSAPGVRPFVVIGMPKSLEAWLARHHLPAPPRLPSAGSAEVWAGRTKQKTPYLAIRVRDEAALSALVRPLPHYGREGWLVFEGARVVAKGIEPPGKMRE